MNETSPREASSRRRWRRELLLVGTLAVVLVALIALLPIWGFGLFMNLIGPDRFSYLHVGVHGPVSPEAAELAGRYQLGPDGFGLIKLGMRRDDVEATGEFVYHGKSSKCSLGQVAGTKVNGGGSVIVSDTYGVAEIQIYQGVRTPEGVSLGSSLDQVRDAYRDTKVETGREVGDGGTEMDDHYRASVPGNPNASYRIFVDKNRKVDDLSLVLNVQNCR